MPRLVVALDADVLVPILSCDFLLTAFDLGLYEPVVSTEAIAEVEWNLIEDFPHLDPGSLRRRVSQMRDALDDHVGMTTSATSRPDQCASSALTAPTRWTCKGSVDLLISLYAGFISENCTSYLGVGGTLLVSPSHGDPAVASIDPRYRLAGVVTSRSGRYFVSSRELATYLVPKRTSR
ncbi:MAG: hypothetical protein LC118_06445 [Dehalococcoidia bacterium]|nr:hypothetical protein [Dehalococcoidia bacterium]